MDKAQTLEEFYYEKLNFVPIDLKKEVGHFNVFRLDDYVGSCAKSMPYSRKYFFKISLIIGKNIYHYADKSIEIKKNALMFANPQIPYNWEPIDDEQTGFFCIFNEIFFQDFLKRKLSDYPVFKPDGNPIYFLSDEQVKTVSDIFLKMFIEMQSDYIYKYDVIKNYILELIHSAQKMQPEETLYIKSNASARISSLFTELLERQFPIEIPEQQVTLRTANDFARQLSIHVNHLNHALKETTSKTTSEIISERIIQEAVILLKHTDWNIADIAYSLGFEETTHFNNYFKKRTNQTPGKFRTI